MNLGVEMTEGELANEVATLGKLSAFQRKSVILMAQRLAREARQRDERQRVDLQHSDLS